MLTCESRLDESSFHPTRQFADYHMEKQHTHTPKRKRKRKSALCYNENYTIYKNKKLVVLGLKFGFLTS